MYPSTVNSWPEDGVIQIFGIDGCRIALFSISFLHKGGVLSWTYVKFAVQSVVLESGHIEQMIDEKDARSQLPSSPKAGSYIFIREDDAESPPTLRVGPRFQYRQRGPSASGNNSDTMSNSSRRSANQDNFRFQLAVRDGFCLVTESKKAVAAHILPLSRPEYYTEVLGFDPGYLFDVSYGLLLSRDLHHAFDRGEWSLFPKPEDPDTLLVHVFYSDDPTDQLKSYHGKEVKKERFRYHSALELPNRSLLAFHYRECVIKHVRLVPYFPS